MAKKKERSEVEYLRSENRKLKSENKTLKKEVGRQKKRQHLVDNAAEFIEEVAKEKENEEYSLSKERCPECSNEIDITDLGGRKLYSCECGYRTTKKK